LAIQYWEKAVALHQTFAIAWRNLGWGYYRSENNIPKAIAAYEKAIAAKSDDPMYYAEIDVLYEMNNTDLQTRLKLFDGKHSVAKRRADSWYREAKVLNLKGDYARVIQDLTENNFAIREGQNHLREANVDASILLAKQKMAASKYQDALTILLNAHALPGQNVEKSECDDERMPQLDYFIGLVYKALKNKQKSGFHFNRSANYKLKESDYIRYYQALSMINLGQKDKANSIFDYFIKYGQERLTKGQEVDYFAKYGERETLSQMKSSAHLLIGLGLKGLNKLEESKENLKKAVDFNASNIWAKAEL
jgi:tetratricopeptide (TPR) repeat protein